MSTAAERGGDPTTSSVAPPGGQRGPGQDPTASGRSVRPWQALLVALVVLAPLLAVPTVIGQGTDQGDLEAKISQEATSLRENVTLTRDVYLAGNHSQALDIISEAFFVNWESSTFDRRLRALDLGAYNDLEQELLRLRSKVKEEAPDGEVRAQHDRTIDRIDAAELQVIRSLEGDSYLTDLGQSFLIIFREGVEAILIVGIVVAYLRRVERPDVIKPVYLGALLALPATVVTWLMLQVALDLSVEAQLISAELIEAFSLTIATIVLISISFWLISKLEVEHWIKYLKGKLGDSVGRGATWSLSAVSFLAVYREGFETILFYQGLTAGGAETGGLAAGFVIGLVALAIFYGVIWYTGKRVPLKPLFAGTSALLYYLAFRFAGKAVQEFQEVGWVALTPLLDLDPVLSIWVGLQGSLEGLVVQGLMIAMLIIGVIVTLRRPLPPIDETEPTPTKRSTSAEEEE